MLPQQSMPATLASAALSPCSLLPGILLGLCPALSSFVSGLTPIPPGDLSNFSSALDLLFPLTVDLPGCAVMNSRAGLGVMVSGRPEEGLGAALQ